MPKRYAREFRRAVCARLVAGERVVSLSKELGVSEATLYLWKRQALIDAGRAEGVSRSEPALVHRRPPSNPDSPMS
jgi:transposase-like protein